MGSFTGVGDVEVVLESGTEYIDYSTLVTLPRSLQSEPIIPS